jgi:hypothetical protein
LSGRRVSAVVVAVVVLLVAVTVVESGGFRGERRCDENHRFNLSVWVDGVCFRDRDRVCVENEESDEEDDDVEEKDSRW